MTTPRSRVIVSLAAGMCLVLALGACARGAPGPAPGGAAFPEEAPLTIRFDNGARQHVHVYLVGEKREWLLGRVEPGANETLRIPEAAVAGSRWFVRLAVVAGERPTLQAARDVRAVVTAAQPVTQILSQRWTFAQGQLTSVALRGASAGTEGVDRPS